MSRIESASEVRVPAHAGPRCGRVLAATLSCAALAQAQDVRLHGLFGDHMVLPQATEVIVPGRAAPGAILALSAPWLDAPVRATADAAGRFRATLRTPAAGGPFQLTVQSGSGPVLQISDVLVGDVWLGSGQSNMEMPVGPMSWSKGTVDWQDEIAGADLPQLRLFTLRHRAAAAPCDDIDGLGDWQVCTPANAAQWSAVAFYFGREVLRHRSEPLGLFVSCWGGTVCEAWTRSDGLGEFPEFAAALQSLRGNQGKRTDRLRSAFWQAVTSLDPTNGSQRPEAKDIDASGWSTAILPMPWSKSGLAAHDGVGWYRRTVPIPAAWRGRELVLQLGPIDDMNTVWFDGRRVGGWEEPGHWQEALVYAIPADAVTDQFATLAVRVIDTGGEGGFTGTAEAMRLAPKDGDGGAIDLSGGWIFHVGAALDALPPFPAATKDQPNVPSVLWNGMIAPLQGFPFRGVLWYQGEANRERAEQYGRLFPAMIRDWRAAFGRELPFLFVQIAPFGYRDDHGELFALRLAQERALQLPGTGMAASTDVGDPRDIHPQQKRAIGERLARLALRQVYGDQQVVAGSPRPRAVVAEGSSLRVLFAAGGLKGANGSATVQHFEVAGADGVFQPAVATIDGAAIVLHSDAVPAPRTVRYCHRATAMADLWNEAGWPAVPFVASVDD